MGSIFSDTGSRLCYPRPATFPHSHELNSVNHGPIFRSTAPFAAGRDRRRWREQSSRDKALANRSLARGKSPLRKRPKNHSQAFCPKFLFPNAPPDGAHRCTMYLKANTGNRSHHVNSSGRYTEFLVIRLTFLSVSLRPTTTTNYLPFPTPWLFVRTATTYLIEKCVEKLHDTPPPSGKSMF